MSAFLLAVTGITGMDKVVPKVAGVESWELSFKISRRWGHFKKGIPQDEVIVVGATGNFHGRSLAQFRCQMMKTLEMALDHLYRVLNWSPIMMLTL